MRRATAERKLRILERLMAGVSVPHIARTEDLTIRRLRQIIAEMLARREVDPPAGFVPLQIARLSDAMQVAHTMMMEGDLKAMDRVIRLAGELDRYHGYGRARAAAPHRGAGARAAARQARARGDRSGNFSSRKALKNFTMRQETRRPRPALRRERQRGRAARRS
jgi:hypothetical protein